MMSVVLASALAPFAYGVLHDMGWTVAQTLLVFAAGGLIAALPLLAYAVSGSVRAAR